MKLPVSSISFGRKVTRLFLFEMIKRHQLLYIFLISYIDILNQSLNKILQIIELFLVYQVLQPFSMTYDSNIQ